MIAWTTVMVTGLGSIAMAFMLQPPKPLRGTPKVPLTPAALIVEDTRAPASVGENAKVAPLGLDALNQFQAVDLTLPCKGVMRTHFKNSVTQVRLIGQTCRTGRTVSSEILNTANSFSATVFYPTERTFTTDYITLRVGTNHIRIVHQMDKGSEEREYIIERDAR